jgi:G3E family GTPase
LNKIPVYLITGFLGSGKTTLIQRLLGNYFPNQRLAVIQNEFAPHNFDGEELKRHSSRNFDLLEINNGSVFCVCLLSDFILSFDKFVNDYKPDVIIFEASGLSDPIAVGELFNSPKLSNSVLLAGIICIVDATRFLKLEKLQQRMIHQVQVADHIILNKTDLISDYQQVLSKLKDINPQSEISITSFCEIDLEQLVLTSKEKHDKANATFMLSTEDLGRPDIKSVVLKSVRPVKSSDYIAFLTELSTKMIRLKGILYLDTDESISFQYAGNEIMTSKIDRNIKQTEIIAMGFELSPGDVNRMYNNYLSQ